MNLRYKLVYKSWRLDEGRHEYCRHAATIERINEIATEIKTTLNPMMLEIIDTQTEPQDNGGNQVMDNSKYLYDIWSDDNCAAPVVQIDQATGQFETYDQYKARCAADYPILEQVPYDDGIYIPSANGHDWLGNFGATLRDDVAIETEINTNVDVTGISQQIRNALIFDLGYFAHVANLAVIGWRLMDNGQYGWIADLPNGASHYWVDGEFRRPVPRAQLTEPQVKELTIQLEYFTDLSYESDDLDVCINASVFALAIMKILG